MTARKQDDRRDEEYWRRYLANPDPMRASVRRILSRLPDSPRCRLCASPFAGIGAPIMRLVGKRPSDANPNVCNTCQSNLIKHHGGAEVESSMVFADIRGSTSLAESMTASQFHALLDRFYTAASEAVFKHDGMVDKFVGDELVAIFPPMLSPQHHPSRALDAAKAVLLATGHGDPAGPWAPVGAGVHTGTAWFGAVGEGSHVELTAVGDNVNVTARLAAASRAGEILVSAAVAQATGLDPGLERRTLELKGKQATVEVVSLRAGEHFG